MSDKITDDIADRLRASLDAGISEESMKVIKKKVADLLYEIETDIDYRLKDDLAPNLVAYTVEMAEKAVSALLAGNQQQMERYLGCDSGRWTGRSTEDIAWGRKRSMDEWHPVIHGRLFEQGFVQLRRDVVAAHRDLIESQRILDLEDQVKALVAQVNKKTDEIERLHEERRHA